VNVEMAKGIFVLMCLIFVLFIFTGRFFSVENEVMASPFDKISFVEPTPENQGITSNPEFFINTSLYFPDLNKLIYSFDSPHWSGEDYNVYDDSLIFMMNFDNIFELGENDSRVVDVSNSAYSGVIKNAVWTREGKFDGAYEFNGVDSNIIVENNSKLNFNWDNAFSLSVWVKCDYVPTSVDSIIDKTDFMDYPGYSLSLFPETRKLFFTISSENPENYIAVRSREDICDGTWKFVVATYDGSGFENRMFLYIDAIWQKKTSFSGNAINGLNVESNANFSIGSRADGSQFFNGSIDEVRVWSRMLYPKEIERMYYMNLKKLDLNQWSFYADYPEPFAGDYNFEVSALSSVPIEKGFLSKNNLAGRKTLSKNLPLKTTGERNVLIYSVNFYQFPEEINSGEQIKSYCTLRGEPQNLNVTMEYKENTSQTWLPLDEQFVENRKKIFVTGDSITAGFPYYSQNPITKPYMRIEGSYPYWLDYYMNSNVSAVNESNWGIYNVAVPGAKCDEVYDKLYLVENNSDYLIIMCGTNDLGAGQGVANVETELEQIYNMTILKGITPILMTIPPRGDKNICEEILEVNAWIQNFASEKNISLVDLYPEFVGGNNCNVNQSLFISDTLHPNLEGYKKIAKLVWEQGFDKVQYNTWVSDIVLTPQQSTYYDFRCTVNGGDNDVLINEGSIFTSV